MTAPDPELPRPEAPEADAPGTFRSDHASAPALAWCFSAGAFLFLAPAIEPVWSRVVGVGGVFGAVAETDAARGLVAGVGLLLVILGTWDVAVLLGSRWIK